MLGIKVAGVFMFSTSTILIRATTTPKFWRLAAECLVSCLALISVTVVCYRLHFNLTANALLLMIFVVLTARLGSFFSSIFASIVAALCLTYMVPPALSFRVTDPLDGLAIIAFLSTSLIIARLMATLRKSEDRYRTLADSLDTQVQLRTQQLEKRNAELRDLTALLQTREEVLKTFVKHVPAAVAMLDCDMLYLQVSDRWCADFSLDSSKLLGRSHYEVFPDLPERWRQSHRQCLEGETLRAEEDRWDRAGGTTWLRWEVRPWHNLDGVPGGILIFSEDITHRKHAEEALLGMSRKLIEAHEQERTRIARDLHDDVVQRLVLLSLELEEVQENIPDAELRTRIGRLGNQTRQIADDVQLISHELHSKIDYLGIVEAAKNFCEEFGERHKVEIDFQSHDLPTGLPAELSLSLFRVLQEALRNAAKHSGVKRFEVRLWGSTGEIQLSISDLGSGFNTETAMKSSGLGLTSMQERLRLVHGELSIKSQPKGGTTIHARVPLGSGSDSLRAAG